MIGKRNFASLTNATAMLDDLIEQFYTQHPAPVKCNSHDFNEWLHALNGFIDKKVCSYKQNQASMADYLALRSMVVDTILIRLFNHYRFINVSLFAVGGYGRRQLLPASDVDILIILSDDCQKSQVEQFITHLWQLNLTPAASVQFAGDMTTSAQEHTLACAWLESRLLIGIHDSQLPYWAVKQAWQFASFYHVKLQEAKARYLAHQNTEYNLEPNIKNAPGGLRDIQFVAWLGAFLFQSKHNASFDTLVAHQFLVQSEYQALTDANDFFWQIRHHLHTINQKSEERLLFCHQNTIAKRMGYQSDSQNGLAEALMKDYYYHAMTVASLSDMLCQLFFQNYIAKDLSFSAIDAQFGTIMMHNKQYLCITNPFVFEEYPSAILKLFLWMGHLNIQYISPQTLRHLRLASTTIDDNYRQNAQHQRLFIQNLKQSNLLFHRLRLMKRFGVLGAYIPAFGQIMGMMQFDLFHRYTVDMHTLLLIRILHRLKHNHHFGQVAQVYHRLDNPYILVIASIFHDIAKGQGGDHSELGAKLAYDFCCQHRLPEDDRHLIVFLIKEHLSMSLIAQKQDIYDAKTLMQFAQIVGSVEYLDFLYVFTVADMNATNDTLWNNWRATLINQLYFATHRLLLQGNHPNDEMLAYQHKLDAQIKLSITNTDMNAVRQFWRHLSTAYFLKHSAFELAWHARVISSQLHHHSKAIVAIESDPHHLNLFKIMIYAKDTAQLFSKIVGALDMAGFTVMGANIFTTQTAYALNTLTILDIDNHWEERTMDDHDMIAYQQHQICLHDTLVAMIDNLHDFRYLPKKRYVRHLSYFKVPTCIEFKDDNPTQLHLSTKDRPSLLATIGQIFDEFNISVYGAKITTLGERAEDVFYLSIQEKPLDEATKQALKNKLIATLDDMPKTI